MRRLRGVGGALAERHPRDLVKDAPMATVVLHQLMRSGQEPMASIVLDFVGGRRDGPRRKAKLRAKLRAKKDTRGKAPRKQLAIQYHMRRRVVDGLL